jgi:retron-type reverse transcriptase
VNWILDADIKGFFDTISHDWLMRFVEHQIGDRRVLRLIGKWLTRLIHGIAGIRQ